MQYKTLYQYFPAVALVFAKREMPKKVAIPVARRVMKLAGLHRAAEQERLKLVDVFAEKDEAGQQVQEVRDGQFRVKMTDPLAFQNEWEEMLEAEIEDYPEFTKLTEKQLPNDISPLEIEALLELGLLEEGED